MTSEEFKSIRLELGLTQAQLGKLMGMMVNEEKGTCPAIYRIETNRNPTKIHAAFIECIRKNQKLEKTIDSMMEWSE